MDTPAQLPALERLENVVNTLAPTFLIGSSSFFHVTRTAIRSPMILKFDEVRTWTAELAAHKGFEQEDQWSCKRSPENWVMQPKLTLP